MDYVTETMWDSDKRLLLPRLYPEEGAELKVVSSEPSGILEEHQATEPWCSRLLLIHQR